MKKIQSLLFAFICVSMFAFGQYKTIDNFENKRPDTLYAVSLSSGSSIKMSADSIDKFEGGNSLLTKNVYQSNADWGGWLQIGYSNDSKLLDWGSSDSLSVWVKVTKAPTRPDKMSWRLQVTDFEGGARETWVYQNNSIIDVKHNEWVNLRIPLKARISDGTAAPDSTGFSIAPFNWSHSMNDQKFNPAKISSWYFTVLPTSIDADSVDVKYDKFQQFGSKAVPIVLFNGIDFTGSMTGSVWAWGQSVITVEKGLGHITGTNAIKWVQGNEWNNGWSGWGFNFAPTNMAGGWTTDSLQIKIKAEAGVGKIRIQFEDGTVGGKRGLNITPTTDNQWKTYKLALKDFIYPPGEDSTKKGPIDSTKINTFGIMAEASAVAGKVIYLGDIWTGNPDFDVIAPLAPTGVVAIGGAANTFMNIVTWTDVPNENGAKYSIHFSDKTFTSTDSSFVEDLPPYQLPSGSGAASHVLRAPATDQPISYYYSVNAKDAAGNVGAMALSNKVTTTAKGVPVFNEGAPASFAVDGSVAEWLNASIKPISITKNSLTGEGHVVGNGVVDNDADLSVKAYLAVDANNLYVAFDVVDDKINETMVEYAPWKSYGLDCVDMFIGLYDWRGKRHNNYSRGANPDYHLRFTSYALYIDNPGQAGGIKPLMIPSANYIFKKKSFTPGYIVEAKIPFQTFADTSVGDTKFTSRKGQRIPIDFSVNDNDGKTFLPNEPWNARDGILCYSQFNDDNSWDRVWRWSHTWVGPYWVTNVKQDGIIAKSFELGQNYPNPFNPTTSIRYSIPKAGIVTLKVYDVIGREVMEVLNQFQEVGSYTVNLDASKLATGMYVYRIAIHSDKLETGSFSSVKKMLLLK